MTEQKELLPPEIQDWINTEKERLRPSGLDVRVYELGLKDMYKWLQEEKPKDYARQEAIAFAEWKDTHYKRTSGGSYYGILPQMSRFENPIRYLSLKDVYDKYLEHITMLNKKV